MKFDPLEMTGINQPGPLREKLWSALVQQNLAAYPIPPHGHNPNFKGANAAAKQLALHPLFANAQVILVGMEAALGAVRASVLEARKTLVVPHRTKAGTYWQLKDAPKQAAKLPNLPVYGTAITSLEGVQLAVLASVLVDQSGARLSKGFGFGAFGPPINVPTLGIAHPIMLLKKLPCEADSRLAGLATPERLWVF